MSSGSIYGLFVGIDGYESEDISPLAFASADVLAIRDKLADKFSLDPEKAVILADGNPAGTLPTRREILRTMNRFTGAPMGPEDTFFLVFAGHGFVCSGKTFLAAADSEIGSEALLRETAVSLDSVREFMDAINAGQHIVILDACRNSPVKGTRSVGGSSMSGAMTRDIGAVIRPAPDGAQGITRTRAVMSSCWEGQVAHEYAPGGHGWFCHNLLAELDATRGDELSLSDLHRRVKERMRQSAWQLLPSASGQVPHLLVEGDVPTLTLRAGHLIAQDASEGLRPPPQREVSAGVRPGVVVQSPTATALNAAPQVPGTLRKRTDQAIGLMECGDYESSRSILEALVAADSTDGAVRVALSIALLGGRSPAALSTKEVTRLAQLLNGVDGRSPDFASACAMRRAISDTCRRVNGSVCGPLESRKTAEPVYPAKYPESAERLLRLLKVPSDIMQKYVRL
jgi:hypothetical protein